MPTERYLNLPEEKRRQIWRDYYDFIRKRLVERHGDYWAMQMDGMEYFLQKNGRMPLYFVMFPCSSHIAREYVEWIFHHTDRQNMRLQTVEDFAALQDLCHTLLTLAVRQYQMKGADIREVKRDFALGLSHLKTGFLRTEESL